MLYENINDLLRKIKKETEENFNNEKAIEEYRELKREYDKTKDEIIEEKKSEVKGKIFYNNFPLVVKIARKYEFPSGISIHDLLSFGSIGLLNAIDTYRVNQNTKFSTYANSCINNEITKEMFEWYGEGSYHYGKTIAIYRKIAISIFGGTGSIYDEEIVDYVLGIMKDMVKKKLIQAFDIVEIRSRIISMKPVKQEIIEGIAEEDEDDFDRTAFIKKFVIFSYSFNYRINNSFSMVCFMSN